jgi:hypothetical protein
VNIAVASTSRLSDLPRGPSFIALVTSMCWTCRVRGIIMLTLVVIVCSPKRKRLVGVLIGRSRSISSRVPKNSAPLGQTAAHMGLRPSLVRS